MMAIHIGDRVHLKKGIPELELRPGERGEVQSTWCAPAVAYEVEFRPIGGTFPIRVLLNDEHIELDAARLTY